MHYYDLITLRDACIDAANAINNIKNKIELIEKLIESFDDEKHDYALTYVKKDECVECNTAIQRSIVMYQREKRDDICAICSNCRAGYTNGILVRKGLKNEQ
jgi:hypothetical protein